MPTMPNIEIMQEWVRRLRSGDYHQGKGQLRFNDNYCCLGVLSEMAAEAGVVEQCQSTVPGTTNIEHIYSGQLTMPGRQVYEWAGLACNYGPYVGIDAEVGTPLTTGELAHRNDIGYSFAQIADAIEREWITPQLPTITETAPDTPATLTNELINA